MSKKTQNWQSENQSSLTEQSRLQIALMKLSSLLRTVSNSTQDNERFEVDTAGRGRISLNSFETLHRDRGQDNDSDSDVSYQKITSHFSDRVDPLLYYIIFSSWYS